MDPIVQVTEEIAFGPQPDKDELRRLAEQGFSGVVSLHSDTEEPPVSLVDERAAASEAGLAWHNVPMTLRSARPEAIDKFRRELARIGRPVFVYDRTGSRAGALIIMDLAVRKQMSGEQALARARELNVQLSDERVVELIREYVDGRRTVPT